KPPAIATRCSSVNWFSAIFSAGFLPIISALATEPPTGVGESDAAEKWVVERLTAGAVADLRSQRDRKLSANFLQKLLVGEQPGLKAPRNGLRIRGAIIEEPIELTNAQIPCDVWLKDCQFYQYVRFFHAKVEGDAVFDQTLFLGP